MKVWVLRISYKSFIVTQVKRNTFLFWNKDANQFVQSIITRVAKMFAINDMFLFSKYFLN